MATYYLFGGGSYCLVTSPSSRHEEPHKAEHSLSNDCVVSCTLYKVLCFINEFKYQCRFHPLQSLSLLFQPISRIFTRTASCNAPSTGFVYFSVCLFFSSSRKQCHLIFFEKRSLDNIVLWIISHQVS